MGNNAITILWNENPLYKTYKSKELYFRNFALVKEIAKKAGFDEFDLQIIDDESNFYNQDNEINPDILNSLQTVEEEKNNLQSVLIILAELTWNNKSQNDFYGFNVALQLRNEAQCEKNGEMKDCRVLSPIVFCSNSSFETIRKSGFGVDALKFGLLEHPCHSFINLSELSIDLSQDGFQLLTENHLLDIQDTCIDIAHFITTLFHDIHGLLKANKRRKEVAEIINNQFKRLENVVTTSDYLKIQELLCQFVDNFETYKTETIIRSARKKVENEIIALITKDKTENNDKKNQDFEKRWRVLYIDDSPDDLARVKKLFNENGIYCCLACSGQEGFKILDYDFSENKLYYNELTDTDKHNLQTAGVGSNAISFLEENSNTFIKSRVDFELELKNIILSETEIKLQNNKEEVAIDRLETINQQVFWPANSITVVVVDWLFKDNGKRSFEQGHYIINHIVEQKRNLVEFLILSGVEERLQRRLVNYRNLIYSQPEIIAKSNYHSILQTAIYKGNRIFEEIVQKPKGTWCKSYEESRTHSYEEYYRWLRMSKYLDYNQTKKDIEKAAQEFIEEAKNYEENEKVEFILPDYSFSEKILNIPEKEQLKKFITKLIARRIVYGLYLSNQTFWTAAKIFSVLTYGKLHNIKTKRSDNENYETLEAGGTVKSFFSSVVVISTDIGKDIDARNFLLEEQLWLEKYLTIDFKKFHSKLYKEISVIINYGRSKYLDMNLSENTLKQIINEHELLIETIPTLLKIEDISEYLDVMLSLCRRIEFSDLRDYLKTEFKKVTGLKKYREILKQHNLYQVIQEINSI